jgi:hypothetical protein
VRAARAAERSIEESKSRREGKGRSRNAVVQVKAGDGRDTKVSGVEDGTKGKEKLCNGKKCDPEDDEEEIGPVTEEELEEANADTTEQDNDESAKNDNSNEAKNDANSDDEKAEEEGDDNENNAALVDVADARHMNVRKETPVENVNNEGRKLKSGTSSEQVKRSAKKKRHAKSSKGVEQEPDAEDVQSDAGASNKTDSKDEADDAPADKADSQGDLGKASAAQSEAIENDEADDETSVLEDGMKVTNAFVLEEGNEMP